MSQSDEIWRKLTAAARQAPPRGDDAAPFGFASRVSARALGSRRSGGAMIERLALRALSVAGLAAALALVTHLSVPASNASDDESLFTLEDPAAIVLGVTGDE